MWNTFSTPPERVETPRIFAVPINSAWSPLQKLVSVPSKGMVECSTTPADAGSICKATSPQGEPDRRCTDKQTHVHHYDPSREEPPRSKSVDLPYPTCCDLSRWIDGGVVDLADK